MRVRVFTVMVLLTAVLVVIGAPAASAAPGTQQAQAPAGPGPATGAAPPDLDPASVAALKRMGDHLAALRSFEIVASISFEYVFDNEQKLLIGGTVRHR